MNFMDSRKGGEEEKSTGFCCLHPVLRENEGALLSLLWQSNGVDKGIMIGQRNADKSSASRSFNLGNFDFCAVQAASDQA
jgi:hypothetical protein